MPRSGSEAGCGLEKRPHVVRCQIDPSCRRPARRSPRNFQSRRCKSSRFAGSGVADRRTPSCGQVGARWRCGRVARPSLSATGRRVCTAPATGREPNPNAPLSPGAFGRFVFVDFASVSRLSRRLAAAMYARPRSRGFGRSSVRTRRPRAGPPLRWRRCGPPKGRPGLALSERNATLTPRPAPPKTGYQETTWPISTRSRLRVTILPHC